MHKRCAWGHQHNEESTGQLLLNNFAAVDLTPGKQDAQVALRIGQQQCDPSGNNSAGSAAVGRTHRAHIAA